MKKFSLLAVLALGGILFAGCKDKEKDKEPEPAADPEATVLVDNTYESFNVFGKNKIVVGDEDLDNDWAVKEYNGMTAISLKQAKDIDESLYNTLKTKSIKGLYKFEGVALGTYDAGWDKDCIIDGQKTKLNGSYVLKCTGNDKNEDDEWIQSIWFPSAEAHGESLTPSKLFITDNMTDDPVDGFDHNSDPVALEAGVYTVVLATYKAAVGDMGIMCGMGIVKTEERDAVQPPETYPITSMDIAGSFEGSDGDNWGKHPVVMTKNSDDVFEGNVTVTATDEFKVRLNCDWAYSLGSAALESKTYSDAGNIKLGVAGTYKVSVKLGAAAYADFLTDKTILIFTVVALVD